MKLSTAISFLPLVAGFTSPSISTRSNVVVASPLKPAFYVARGGSQDHINASTSQSTTASISLASSSTSIESDIGPSLSIISQGNWDLLSARGKAALSRLILWDMASGGGGQKHVYGDWPEVGVEDEEKRMLAEQVRCVVCVNLVHMHRIDIDGIVLYVLQISSRPPCQQKCCSHHLLPLSQIADLDGSYPGGLPAYLSKAQTLLKESADGTNPFAEFEAYVPEGESLSFEDPNASAHTGMTFSEAEQAGLTGIGDTVFVLVAGGLGERLGYSGIKLGLETNTVTNKSYLEVYAKYIQAMQRMAHIKTGKDHIRIPLVIMTSDDTDPLTRKLLEDNDNFGFDEGQVTIVKQEKVAALSNGNAGLSMKSKWKVETKPHGHGDVHHLLYREGLVDHWYNEGKKHVIFLQDTNALVINSVLPTLGVSIAKGFHMNSICIPRLAGEAAGAIARLEHKTDPEKVRS